MSASSRLKNSCALLALLVNVTACGGGGGGGSTSSSATTAATIAASAPAAATTTTNTTMMASGITVPGPTPLNPALYPKVYTSEYYGNYGLDLVHAGNAYVAGLTGAGVTVAVVDNGIANIAKLQGQIAQTIDLTSGAAITDFHGTAVASVLAAISNGIYMHGVAYGAQLVNIRASSTTSFTDANLQTALNIAAGQNTTYGTVNASIINMSIAGALSSGLQAGLVAAVNAGKLIVMAAGNDGTATSPALNPEASALFATQAAAKGQVIIAGALTQAGTIATYSNLAGSGAAFYLLAPGDKLATYDHTGAQITASGTSFAVPMIAGAAALLEQEFPNLSAAKVVQILISTADPLSTGSSATYGAGVLDLAKAIQPIGTLSVPTGATTSGSSTPMTTSGMVTTASFGDGPANALAGKQVLTLDSFQRGYVVGLGNATHEMREMPDYQNGFMNPVSMMSVGAQQLRGFDNAGNTLTPVGFAIVPANNAKPLGMDVALSLKGGTVAEFGQHATPMNLTTGSLPDTLGANDAGEPLFMRGELSVLPQASFVTDGYGGAISHRFAYGMVTVAAMSNNTNIDDYTSRYRNPANGLVQVSGGTRIAGVDLGLGIGRLSERDRTFGAVSSGALSLGAGASSTFVTMMAKSYVTDTLELNAAYTQGYTAAGKATNGLFTHLDTIASNAFAVGAVEHGRFVAGDSLGLQVAQPVRVSNARADLLLPVGLDADGNIYRSAQRVNLAPQGREIDMQIAYRAPLMAVGNMFGAGDDVQAFVMARFNPGHDATAATDYVGGVRWRFAF